MSHILLQKVPELINLPTPAYPPFQTGDLIAVSTKIQERGKERIQIFEGRVICKKGATPIDKTFTVYKLSSGVGVERIFPFYSPHIAKIEVKKRGSVRRANISFLCKEGAGSRYKVKEKRVFVKSEKK